MSATLERDDDHDYMGGPKPGTVPCTAEQPARTEAQRQNRYHPDMGLVSREHTDKGETLRFVCPHCTFWVEVDVPKLPDPDEEGQ